MPCENVNCICLIILINYGHQVVFINSCLLKHNLITYKRRELSNKKLLPIKLKKLEFLENKNSLFIKIIIRYVCILCECFHMLTQLTV